MFAGRTESDMWDQLEPHIPYLEQVYFAGGEPMMMEEHYNILKELVRREMFDVKLIYNTNFSRLTLKDNNVLDYWKLFNNVSVGASLDAIGTKAEYIRKGTKWDQIERNREAMLTACPNTDFYVSATVSLYNVLHITDFHRDWVTQGYLNPQDWNINILQGPARDRITVLPERYKQQVVEKITDHIEWLRPLDHLQRATTGYESILNFIKQDQSDLLREFFRVNDTHDEYRKESFEQVFPEYKDLRTYVA
jgi:sulfatase maturation enzyme AslB (radical SAM superfamily)